MKFLRTTTTLNVANSCWIAITLSAMQGRQQEQRAGDAFEATGASYEAQLAVFAEFEREILRERVRAGLAHARQNGKRLGRPATAALHADRVRKLRGSGLSKSAIARRLHIGRSSVRRILKERIRS